MSENKPHWSDRARAFGSQLTSFLADHGTHLGMAGGAVLAIAGTATLVASGLAQSVNSAETAQAASTAMYIGSFINMTLGACAEFIANQKSESFEGLFQEINEPILDPRSSKRGATPINDALLQSSDFRQAMLAVTNQLQHLPETRSGITEILRNNPGARQFLVELHREAQKKQGLYQDGATHTDNNEPDDDLNGPGIN